MKIVAAIKAGPAAASVLGVAEQLAALHEATAEALHVSEDASALPEAEAAAASIPLEVVPGPVVAAIVERGADPDVVAVVLGARTGRPEAGPLPGMALEVVSTLEKVVVVVPARTPHTRRLRCILVPLDETAAGTAELVDRACRAGADVVALDVLDESSLPLFTDHAQHEFAAWSEELLARHCPDAAGGMRLEVRVGRRLDAAVGVAREIRPDLVVLGLAEHLVREQVELAQRLLETCRVPVALVPAAGRPPLAGTSVEASAGFRRTEL